MERDTYIRAARFEGNSQQNGRLGKGLQKNLKKVGAQVRPSLPPPRRCRCRCRCHSVVVVLVVVAARCLLLWWLGW